MKKRNFSKIAVIAIIFAVVIIGCQIPGSEGGIRILSGDISIYPFDNVTVGTQLTANYSGNETVSYLWKKGETNVGMDSPIYTPTEAGSYTVTVGAVGYYSKTSDAVIATGAVIPNLSDLQGDVTISPSDNVTTGTELTADYSGSETVTYQWNKDGTAISGAGSNKYTPPEAGSYTVTVSATGYKSKTSDAVIVTGASLPDLPGNVTISPSNNVNAGTELTANYSGTVTVTYQWNKDGAVVSGVTGNKYTPVEAGNYTVTVSATGYASKTSDAVIVIGLINISSVSIIINAPVKGVTPDTTASDSENSGNFSISTVTWSPADDPFLGNKVYTASVTLTANSGYTFSGLSSATVNGQSVEISNNMESAVTLSQIFPATSDKTVTGIAIKTQPSKLTYTHGDTLDLTGLSVTLTHDDNTTEDIVVASFADKNITVNPASGNDLIFSEHNGNPVKITYGDLTCNTNNLTVSKAIPTADDFNISGIGTLFYDGNVKTITVTAKLGKSEGTVTVKYNGSTTAPSAVGTYTVTFDVAAVTNWNAATGINAGTLIIDKGIPTVTDFTINGLTQAFNGSAKTVTITAKSGKTGGIVTVKYNGSTTAPSALGTYIVTFDVAAATNWNAATGLSAGTLTIETPPTPGLAFTKINSDTAYSVSKGMASAAEVVIPSVYNELPVTTIADSGFEDYVNMTSITIPVSVTSIGVSAFAGCNKLTSITIPNSVTSIGGSAFIACKSLTSVTIPNSVTSIEEMTFFTCTSLTSVTIPNSVTSIGDDAFGLCSKLTSITIPNSVTSIGNDAFYYCISLTSITIPNSVTSIGEAVFRDCSSLASIIVVSDNLIYRSEGNCLIRISDHKLISGCKTSIIPNSVTSIGEWAFAFCSGLTSVTIPNSVTSIGEWAFADCIRLTSITIPNSVTSMGNRAFQGCYGLTSVTIPNSVTSMGNRAFSGCSGLTSVTIGSGVTSIGEWAFSGCSDLTSVTIPNNVTSIGYYAFSNCIGMTSVIFQGTINSANFDSSAFGFSGSEGYMGDLRTKFYATNSTIGTPGTYTRPTTGTGGTWTKQP